jgi:hypothetical protein
MAGVVADVLSAAVFVSTSDVVFFTLRAVDERLFILLLRRFSAKALVVIPAQQVTVSSRVIVFVIVQKKNIRPEAKLTCDPA